ncbi:aldo/keto reductase [Isosphaera pallida ATCC 43644]|uniref:Aldo/keto reductase n=1 Tax=Isosphaera pallida (strain ATCC 43644 / DSM 9630 / IS1B) TaxID=575540 RepID=E8R3F4_ISOPI|nr:aldo/keto reductase [Isosphaera pallida]ADV63664.1 aldo/keto reductase [Isosphaera pallida ATCC 43644]
MAAATISSYEPNPDRYDGRMSYRRCGRTGLNLPAISLGCWHNFGGEAVSDNHRRMLFTAFDAGITHFDLANNYGPPPGSAEEHVGTILKQLPRDELIISSKAGYRMWPGPYGEWSSRKSLLASLDQSLKRLRIDYVDLFYSHRFDPLTPLEETMGALDSAVRSGKALYVGISSYTAEQTRRAAAICKAEGFAPLAIHQPNYSMLNRWIEARLLDAVEDLGIGVIAFCPLYQGLLTNRYLNGIPAGSRASLPDSLLKGDDFHPDVLGTIRGLHEFAAQRGQSLAQLALTWVLRDRRVTSALIGASRPEQIAENVKAATAAPLTEDELRRIDELLAPAEAVLRKSTSPWARE